MVPKLNIDVKPTKQGKVLVTFPMEHALFLLPEAKKLRNKLTKVIEEIEAWQQKSQSS